MADERVRALLDVQSALAGVVVTGNDFQDDNEARVRRGAAVTHLYEQIAGLTGEEYETILVDLLTDLRHFVADASLDWLYIATSSETHFVAEYNEGV